ncbi:hypothetical protein EHO59_10130 [Leptospira semungkisensis]|uniref:DUF4381 domain-containing protein n=1 Tax=Leptospira semungkisensis TaxID=2484985 RepID=A0A4R9FZE6_9LEPT|nr:hypothetical protein EHO59_10130 [Leptospira semungkisensis]
MAIVLSLILSSSPLFALKEAWSPDHVSIGQRAEYVLEFQEGEIISPDFPLKGIHSDPDSPDLPLLEVISVNVEKNKIKLIVIYYATGKFTLPVVWKDANSKEYRSKMILTVLSSLSEKDQMPEDILPPLEFSGPYGWKLAALFAALASILLGVLYAWYLHQTKAHRPVDALLQTDPWIHRILIYENGLDELINSPPINTREFYRTLSGYIRENMARKLNTSFAHLTEAELFSKIYDSFPIDGEEARTWENLLRKSQYSGDDINISREDAVQAWDYWKEVLSE